jgi:hypothetical protein
LTGILAAANVALVLAGISVREMGGTPLQAADEPHPDKE